MAFMTFFEAIVIVIYRNILFEDMFNKYLKVMIPLSVGLVFFNKYILSYTPNIAFIIILSIIMIVISLFNKKNIIVIISEVLLASLIVISTELLSMIISIFITSILNIEYELISIISVIIIWIITSLVLIYLRNRFNLEMFLKIRNNTFSMGILIDSIIIFFMFKTLYESGVLHGNIAIEIALYVIIFIIISFIIYRTMSQEIEEKNKLKLENNFKPILDEYIEKLRANEHEYKNHLNAIYSMISVCDENEIKNQVSKYIHNIKNSDYLNNLLYVNNTILKSILYSKISLAESRGIKVKYNIKSNLENIKLDDMDLVVVLSNLLNNAIEASKDSINPYIEVIIEEKQKRDKSEYSIKVTNSVRDMESINIDSITGKGFSTKNNNRGYGLYNIKKIVKRVNGNLLIEPCIDLISIEVIV